MRSSMPRQQDFYTNQPRLARKTGPNRSFFTRLAVGGVLLSLTVGCAGLQTSDPVSVDDNNAPRSQQTATSPDTSQTLASATEGSDTVPSGSGVQTATASQEPTNSPSAAPSSPVSPTKVSRTQRGDGKLARYQYTGATPTIPQGAKVRRIAFATEGDIGVDPSNLADTALRILNDKRSWAGDGYVFVPVNKNPHTTILIASPVYSAKLCRPLETGGILSCRKGNRVILTSYRWFNGHQDFKGDLEKYRTYLINHEVGHSLGHGHVDCPGKGKLAPVMMQQTKGTLGCVANGWVHPNRTN